MMAAITAKIDRRDTFWLIPPCKSGNAQRPTRASGSSIPFDASILPSPRLGGSAPRADAWPGSPTKQFPRRDLLVLNAARCQLASSVTLISDRDGGTGQHMLRL